MQISELMMYRQTDRQTGTQTHRYPTTYAEPAGWSVGRESDQHRMDSNNFLSSSAFFFPFLLLVLEDLAVLPPGLAGACRGSTPPLEARESMPLLERERLCPASVWVSRLAALVTPVEGLTRHVSAQARRQAAPSMRGCRGQHRGFRST